MYSMYGLSVVKKLAREMSPPRRVRHAHRMLGAVIIPCQAQMSGTNVGHKCRAQMSGAFLKIYFYRLTHSGVQQ